MKPLTQYILSFADVVLIMIISTIISTTTIAMTNSVSEYNNKVLDFNACIQAGLKHSPLLKRSSIEINIRRLNESDMRWDYIPSVFINTSYLITSPDYVNDRATFSFSTGPYDFIQPYFAIRAAKEFTRIAVLVHLQTIAEGLYESGKVFLRLDFADQALTIQDEIIRLTEQNIDVNEAMKGLANYSPIDKQIAEKELEEARIEKEKLIVLKTSLTESLLSLMGLPLDSKINIITTNASNQVIDRFDPRNITLSQAKEHSVALEISTIKKKLQELNIRAAYAKYIPSPVLSIITADPLYNNTDTGSYLVLGINLLAWDGFDRRRNVTRQKDVLKQYDLDYDMEEQKFIIAWKVAQNQNNLASLDLKAAETIQEITKLKTEQIKIKHESGALPIGMLQENRRGYLLAQKNRISKNLDYYLSILYVRHLSGELRDSFINPKSFSVELHNTGGKEGNRE
ncbi:MAG: TolC family protein [Kiritimatiellae bacterium]|nr:TolC family protein [Kiritimatiellia bacterium]MDD5521688.1 TolC family protein [Kiritimatiellia bacterium]